MNSQLEKENYIRIYLKKAEYFYRLSMTFAKVKKTNDVNHCLKKGEYYHSCAAIIHHKLLDEKVVKVNLSMILIEDLLMTLDVYKYMIENLNYFYLYVL